MRLPPAEGSNPDSRPVLFKYNHRSLNLKRDSVNLNHLQEIDMKKVEALKKAVSDGTYAVPAEDLAPKLMESMFQNTILDETPNRVSGSQLEAKDRFNPSNNEGLEIPGGEIVSRKGSHSASMPSDGSPAERGPKSRSR
jgi:hypothetical protein